MSVEASGSTVNILCSYTYRDIAARGGSTRDNIDENFSGTRHFLKLCHSILNGFTAKPLIGGLH